MCCPIYKAMSKLLCVLALSAAFGGAAESDPKKSAAIEIVIEMMQKTADKILAAEEAENKTYKEFAWFCKDTEEEKDTAIKESNLAIQGFKANVNEWTSDVEGASKTIGDLELEIPGIEKDLEEASATRAEETAEYKKNNAEVENALTALGKAIKELKAADMGQSFLQTSVGKTVKAAVLLGSNLGLKSAGKAARAVGEEGSYDDVVGLLEELQEQFRSQNQDEDLAEARAEAAYKKSIQALKNELKSKKKALASSKESKASKEADISKAKQDLAEATATREDDEKYLEETKTMCQEKEVTFLQRTAMRAEEMEALEEAKQIIKEVKAQKSDSTEASGLVRVPTDLQQQPGLLADEKAVQQQPKQQPELLVDAEAVQQQPKQQQPKQQQQQQQQQPELLADAKAVQQHKQQPNSLMDAKAIQPAARPLTSGFLQKREEQKSGLRREYHQVHPLAAQQDVMELTGDRAKLVELLSSSARKLHSRSLALLVTRAREDPFKVVKQLIEGLITKLQDQASEAQDKKMYCDHQIGNAELQRDEASGKVTELNLALEKLGARRDTLTDEINTLTESLSSLAKQLDKAEALRTKEAEEARAEVEDAETAASAVDESIRVLSAFYSSSKKAEVPSSEALLQQPAADAPDAGFKSGEAYKGEQGSSVGIIGALESIKDEFSRSISETKQLEQEALEEHKKLSQDIATSTSAKEKEKSIQSRFLTEANDEISESTSALERQTSSLKSALEQLGALEEECGIGAGYDDRKKAREEEMQHLKDAIAVLDELLIS